MSPRDAILPLVLAAVAGVGYAAAWPGWEFVAAGALALLNRITSIAYFGAATEPPCDRCR